MEDFKSITGFKNYLINSEGIIKNIISGKVLSQKPDNSGYPRVFLTDDNGRQWNDYLLKKKFTREQVAEVFGTTPARVSEIVNRPWYIQFL